MFTAPQHDWSFFVERSQASDAAWLRSQTIGDRFALYKSLFNAVSRNAPASGHLDRWRWEQKLAARIQQLQAFSQFDRQQRERSAPNDAR